MTGPALLIVLAASPALQVQGTVNYQDRVYDATGFTGAQPFRPIRRAEVEILRSSDDLLLGLGVTDDAGAFSIAAIPGNTDVYARVYARRTGGGIHAVVVNSPGGGAVYAAVTGSATTDALGMATLPTLNLTIAGGAAPAFNIFDAAVGSFEYQATVDADLPVIPPLLRYYWQAGSTDGTYFSSTDNSVHLLGAGSDPDQYDDDIIFHETGHWVAENFSKDDTLGGPHSVTDQLDPRTSWSEGWAHYWSAAVRRSFPALYAQPQILVDNVGAGSSMFDLESPSFPAQAVMATNELAVAAVLWDITDAANEGAFDLLTGNETEVWQAVNVRIPLRTSITLEDFREGLALEAPALMPDVTGSETVLRIMNARLIRYYPNLTEPNEDAGSAVVLASGPVGATLRTLFAGGDADWYAVTLAPGVYRAETLNLGDGGDTVLGLFGPDGLTLLAQNDDRSAVNPASSVLFSVPAAATYYLRVTATGAPCENGYYDIRVDVSTLGPGSSLDAPHAGYCSASAAPGPAPGATWALPLLVGILLCLRKR